MPTVNCKVNNYVYVKEGEHIVFFNDIFEDKTYLILLASLIELLCPDTSSFDIPVSIEVKVDENSVINLSENLEVTGSKEYRYFILKSHYEKWKKTSFISNCILITISFITALFFLYLFLKSNKNYIMGICFFIVLSITIANIVKLFNQFKKVKRYVIEDRKIIWTKKRINIRKKEV